MKDESECTQCDEGHYDKLPKTVSRGSRESRSQSKFSVASSRYSGSRTESQGSSFFCSSSRDSQSRTEGQESCKTEVEEGSRFWLFYILEALTCIGCISSSTYALSHEECYGDYLCFRNLMLCAFVCGVFLFLLVLNHKLWFRILVDWIQSREIFCGTIKLPNLMVSSFLFLGFVDFLLLSISAACDVGDDCDEPLLDPHGGNGEVRHITRTLTAVCAILFLFTVLAHWDHFSYLCAHHSWIHGFLYFTIAGGIFLEVCRWLVPPGKTNNERWSWHTKQHSLSDILDKIMLIALGFVIMFVWLSAISVALFTEIANGSWVLGAYGATLLYCILALILGVSPLAPGSIADTVGGFLLVKVYMHDSEGYNFGEALLIAMAFVTVLHFVGSCFQYWIGKVKYLKTWANFSLPPDILAASDSVLLDANCITVGIVGQVFMDTFSGLNQGRMDMNFITQFFSEYASLPTGYSWVAFGAVLSVQGLRGYEWATHVLPICLIMAATWQFLGTTVGGYKIVKANKNEKFWKNKEKWETVQYFSRQGVKATKEGWRNDCFCLNDKGVNQEDWESLFDKIEPLNKKYIDTILDPKMSVREKKITQKTYNHDSLNVRTNHWKKLETLYFVGKIDGIQQVNEKW